ncbi:TPA: helix-turn-helix domain-containing protein [Citrobacter freundii]|nr:helix-turn-helix domain-containing protein [Citrobacter freundii]
MNSVYTLKTINQLRPLLTGFRKANGLTQKDIAERLGVTQQTYACMEANPGSASTERLFRVLSILGVEMVFSYISSSKLAVPAGATGNQKDSPARKEKW